MRRLLKKLGFGYLKQIFKIFKNYLDYRKEYKIFKATNGQRFLVEDKDKYPLLNDKSKTTGFDKHYVYHTAWAARKLQEISPKEHIDISSLLYFSTIVSAFIPIRFYDFRPAHIELDNLHCEHADVTALPFEDNSINSLSCMHVVEHIGLGRYGDPIDINGDLKAISELKRVLSRKGSLLFVVPIGLPKIMFNAHRIYSYDQICSYFEEFELMEYALIPDMSNEGLIINATKEQSNLQHYGCGCFWFKKK
ncbi:DUF268 domain-containing protein [Sulfurovum sp.]|uniref:DUF268 domain-containing protein n=1 Tax=Sulfurovum sp. TaxID=1969726 RepID=UPI00356AD8A5